MTAWLASIVGVVVVGVVVDLLTQGRRMGNFVRSIYGFIVLFVIVSPLPKLLKTDWGKLSVENLVNAELVEDLRQGNQQTEINQILRTMGYTDAIITLVDDTVYVNLGVNLEEKQREDLKKALGEGVIIL